MWYFIGCIISFVLCLIYLKHTNKEDHSHILIKIYFYSFGILWFTICSWLGVIIILLNIKYDTKYRLQN